MTTNQVRVRPSIEELASKYKKGNKKPLETVMRAWKGIKELPPSDRRSFFVLGGYHGEPFRGAGWGTNTYWGGYCNHGNVLFPTWHRVYLVKLEEALQSIPGCEEVMLPYWDETSAESAAKGIPWPLTDETFKLDGATIPNPLRSFVFSATIQDNINGDNPNYSKPKGYETVRYPLSGLMGPSDIEATEAHNKQFPDYTTNVQILNANVIAWLTSVIVVQGKVLPTHVTQKYKDCLEAPNYTLFSNTTSAAEWNTNLADGTKPVVPLESPHNSVHLAVGGCEVPGYNRSPIDGANGDMGENDTAGLDPIFFFHHAHVDRMFWLWQQKHGFTDLLEIIPEYPGTNSVDNQGPTPGIVPNSWLTLETPLNPFKKIENNQERPYTSLDCVNIETQLGYTYSKGSLQEKPAGAAANARAKARPATKAVKAKTIRISRINRAPIRGSFLVSAFGLVDGKKQLLGTEAVLSRWSVQGCANCQTHLEVKAHFGLHGLPKDFKPDDVTVEIRTRDGRITTPGQNTARAMVAGAQPGKKLFHLEVR